MAKRKEVTKDNVKVDDKKLTPQQKAAQTKKADLEKKQVNESTSDILKASTETGDNEKAEGTIITIAGEPSEEIIETSGEKTSNAVEITVKKTEEIAKIDESQTNVIPLTKKANNTDAVELEKMDKVPEFPKAGSEKIHKILEIHDTYEFLYIDARGCIYDAKTFLKGMNEKAILYKNPYFKNK